MAKKLSIDKDRFKHMKKEVLKLHDKGLSLPDWINTVAAIDPLLAEATEGIYCGEDGRITEQIGDLDHMLVATWHTINGRAKVETCYIS